jgi:probable rRNA maturation factor
MTKPPDIPEIKVRNLQRAVRVDAKSLKRFAKKALPLCLALRKGKKTDLRTRREIFVLIISDRRMASLHRKFLNESGPTDVITFSHGEIFISAETARRHARQFGNSLTGELQLYIVHGLLHLHGFDDRDKTGSRKMKAIQRRILGRVSAR